ncbi:MAG: hypothetical protein WBE91_22185 [Steroidobacteraceae bacterium]
MFLADRVARSSAPSLVKDGTGAVWPLDNTANWANAIAQCPIRYVLQDELVRLCSELAYSKGARTVQCADLLHAPADAFWIEWCSEPWHRALLQHGFRLNGDCQWSGRRGVYVRASSDGRRGVMRTFWTFDEDAEVLASSVEAYFDFDTASGEEPVRPDMRVSEVRGVVDEARPEDDVLARCFRFRYEKTWAEYYARPEITSSQREAVWQQALGTVASDIPMLLTLFLLLATRVNLPRRPLSRERLNRARQRAGKPTLLEHIEVCAPLLPEFRDLPPGGDPTRGRRGPRLHHVRGHLVRRGSQIFWRVPHLRGNARWGSVRSRTVVWTF